jgi:hypothetical protein
VKGQANHTSVNTDRDLVQAREASARSTAALHDQNLRIGLKTLLNWLAVAFGILTGVQALINDARSVLTAIGVCIGALALGYGVFLIIRHRRRTVKVPLWLLVVGTLAGIILFIFFTLLVRR